MRPLRVTLLALGAAIALAASASACGGESGVPEGVVAVVDGTEIAQSELDELIEIAKKSYESREQDFPRVGTPEYQSIQQQYVAFLVQREEFRLEAEKLGVEVAEKDVDDALEEFVEGRFEGDRAELEKALAEQGFTVESFRETLESSVLSQKLFDEVTKDVRVTPEDVLVYYTQNQSAYQTPESRDVRHILIAEKGANDQVDFARSRAEANRIYALLVDGGDFAALAREHSDDPGSKDSGGQLTISRGQTVPAFDKTAFELERGAVSRPVRTDFGFHVIEALSPVREAVTTKLEDVRQSIRTTLLQQRKNEAMTQWVEDLRESYDGKVRYAAGMEPPELPEAPEETSGTE